jgi:hypothetical protein
MKKKNTQATAKTRAASLATWKELAELWLETRHPGRPAAYFSAPALCPASAYPTITRYLPEELMGTIASAEFAVLECDDVDEARRIMEETRGTGIYVMVWDGERIVTHH